MRRFTAKPQRAQSREPDTGPPIEEPEPDPPGVEDPEHPLDPGPAEDPAKQPVRGASLW